MIAAVKNAARAFGWLHALSITTGWANHVTDEIPGVAEHVRTILDTPLHDDRVYAKLHLASLVILSHLGAEIKRQTMEPRAWSYHEYLRSPDWKRVRMQAIRLANSRCQLCNSPHNLHCHHRTYARRGQEDLSDLTVLCADCHELYETNKRARR